MKPYSNQPIIDQKQTGGQPVKRNRAKLMMLSIVGITAALVTGCSPGKYTGGGFIKSVAGGNQKATFGFSFQGIDQDGDGQVDLEVQALDPSDPDTTVVVWGLGKGQFDYNDHGAGVKFHLDCDLMTTIPADGSNPSGCFITFDNDNNPVGANWNGPYFSQAGNGQAAVSITAKGDQYFSLADTIDVQLAGGPYDGYHNSGTIQGGNIQWHPTKSR